MSTESHSAGLVVLVDKICGFVIANCFTIWFQTARDKSWIQHFCLRMAILICCTVTLICCICMLSLIQSHLETKMMSSLQVSKTLKKYLISLVIMLWVITISSQLYSHIMAVYHGGWSKFSRHLVSQHDNFVSVYISDCLQKPSCFVNCTYLQLPALSLIKVWG